MAKLPDFDTLLTMHREDPDALEALRQRLTSELIEQAPSDYQRRLAGLQFRINMELRRASNPTARVLRLQGMMHDSVAELSHCLNHPLETLQARHAGPLADILPLADQSEP